MIRRNDIGVVDLFCGVGGLSFGMKKRGFNIIAGFDTDTTCKYAYETNNESQFISQDVREVTGEQIEALEWKVLIVWQCEIKNIESRKQRLERLVEEIKQ